MNFIPNYKNSFRILKGGKISLVVSSFLAGTTLSFAAPSGGVVTSGDANISQAGKVTNISQSTQKASINWNKFDIASDETVNFKQPNSSSITLNRVVGNEKSIINGALNANGQVWIINSNGVLFGKGASINTSGLLATTKDISDADFQAGNYNFKGNSKESVINLGTIDVINSGSVILAANEVRNEGTIKAIRGKIHLAGADEYTVNLNGNSLVNLTVNKGVLDSLVKNSGTIISNGGEVYLTTNAVNDLLKGVVNNTGVIEANSLAGITGYVELFAHGGEVQVGGKLEAKEGFIETSGRDFSIDKDAKIETAEWLIDPVDITINDTLAGAIATQLGSGNVTIETGAANTPDTSGNEILNYGDIFVASNINYTGTNESTLTLKAYRNIVFANEYGTYGTNGTNGTQPSQKGSISSNNAALNVVLWSRADDAATEANLYRKGSVWVPVGASIQTNGGDITIGGGIDPLTGYSYAGALNSAETNAIYRGVTINGLLNAEGGNISIKAEGPYSGAAGRGISIGGTISTNGSGNISIDGISHTSSDGIGIGDSNPATINIQNGTLTLNGKKGTGANGINFSTAGSAINITGSGFVNANATGRINLNLGKINKSGSGISNLTLKATDHIVMEKSFKIESTSGELNTTLHSDSDGTNGGVIWLKGNGYNNPFQGATINTNGGFLTLSGGIDTTTGYAQGMDNVMGNGITIDSATITTNGGDITLRGKGAELYNSYNSSDDSNTTNNNGIRLHGSNTIDSGTGKISFVGVAQGIDGSSNGIETNSSGYTKILSSATSGDAIKFYGDARTGTSSNGWGTFLWGTSNSGILLAATSGGNIYLEGYGRNGITNAGGVHLEPNAFVLANSGDITITGEKGTISTYADVVNNNTIGYIDSLPSGFGISSSPVTSSSSNINIIADTIKAGQVFGTGNFLASKIQSSGILTLAPKTIGKNLYIQNSTPTNTSDAWFNPNSMFGVNGLFTPEFNKLIFGSETTGSVVLDNYTFNQDTQIKSNNSVTLGAIKIENDKSLEVTTTGNSITDAGVVEVTNLAINASNADVVFDESNKIGVIAANVKSLNLQNTQALSIGTVKGISGITSVNNINIATLNGDLKIKNNISTTSITNDAIVLNAGKNSNSGIKTGGNIIHENGILTTGTNGRVTLFTGGISESTGVSSLVNSGNFRYNSDEAATNYTKSLGSGIFVVYREQPTIKISPDSKNITYGDTVSGLTYGSSGFVNGDDANILAGTASFNINSTKSTSGHHIFGEHDIAYNSGLTNALGYSISDDNSTNNELKVAKKVLTISGITAENKTYDGTTNATLISGTNSLIGLVSGDIVSGDFSSLSGVFLDKNAGNNKAITISGVTINGADKDNYNITNQANTTANISKKDITAVTDITALNKTYDGTTDATLVTTNAKFTGMLTNDKLNIATSKGTFEDKSVGTNKIVNISNLALGGDDVNNYNLLSTISSTTADITAVPTPDSVDPKPEIKKIVDSITNQSAITINLPNVEANTTPNNIGKNVNIIFVQGENQMLVSRPIEGQSTQRVSLSEARQMQIQNGGSSEEVIVPLSNSSIIQLIDGGVNLPSGVEQEFYLANSNTQEEK
ncbi:beta strand repeat-containing protein [Aliarcobacter cryaerophilus]|uniref:beta strand repeat-containing protein n=1 Tax=Aliarcobacter cryaerophilus TaxID=28198 RepID=UPI0016543FC0|nr:YDG domain-containing protein [Aliarcobacter cryaerophilus]QNM91472.1 filamentous hemagglutinin N-terminal domain-containing protein [Aliarcobacter cryaerophilus]